MADTDSADPYLDVAQLIITGEEPDEGLVWKCEELRIGPLRDTPHLWKVDRQPEDGGAIQRLDLFEPLRFKSMVSLANYLETRAEQANGVGTPSGPDREPEDWEVA